ncbi:beta-glucosidase H [Granulosicoccus sp. 3-233]|uniref:beta-glucosidase n=1 Tax=Granulosicoccus sp. 3-233 TaxID=3417969 RepID=UPI003D34A061
MDLEALVDAMTLQEQVSLLSGEDSWSLPAVSRVGIGKLRVTDGPNGARGGGSLIGGLSAAAFPVGICIGASWDPQLAREIGSAIADEVVSKGAHVALAPTVNIHRSVTNGRNFECFAEDPELTAALAISYIEGLQAKRIAATIKHFAGNESEIERTTMNSRVDERTLREVYFRPFEDAVKKAGVWAVMTSYNQLNGTYTSEHSWLINEVLRGDWGFDGLVMSDWSGSHSTAPTVNAGLDLEMPGPTRDRGQKLLDAVETGEVASSTVRQGALNALRLMRRTGALGNLQHHQERVDDRPEHRALIRCAGAAGMVLLKNEGILPLQADGRVAVIGPNARTARIMGGGSSQLNPHYQVTPWEGLVGRLGEDDLSYAAGCSNHRWEPLLEGEFTCDFFASTDFSGPVVHSEQLQNANAMWMTPIAAGKVRQGHFSVRIRGTFVPKETGLHRVGLFSAGYSRVKVDGQLVANAWDGWSRGRTFFEEGCDEVVGTVTLNAAQSYEIEIEFASKPFIDMETHAFRLGIGHPMGDADIVQAVEVAAQADKVVLFVGRSGEWDTEGSDLEDIALPGRQNELVSAVLAANPRTVIVLQTGGPIEMPWVDDVPAILQAWYPGQECGNAIADVLYGDAEPGGRLPQSFPRQWCNNPTYSEDSEIYPGRDGHVRYDEGVFIGYRHYERAGIAPLFAFGHGLSYTSFALSDLLVASRPDSVRVAFAVSNTGDRSGSTVAQIYVGDKEASVPRPLRELKAFRKVVLEPGESTDVQIDLSMRDFAFYDVVSRCWRIEAGAFSVSLGISAVDIVAEVDVQLEAATLSV